MVYVRLVGKAVMELTTRIRFRFDCDSTALRPFDDLRYDRSVCVGCCTACDLNFKKKDYRDYRAISLWP